MAFTATNWLLQRVLTVTSAKNAVFLRTAMFLVSSVDCGEINYHIWKTRNGEEFADSCCCSKICNRQKCELLDNHINTPRSLYHCGKCGAWSHFWKVSFTIQQLVRSIKTEKNTHLLGQKKNCCIASKHSLLSQVSEPIIGSKKSSIFVRTTT